MAVALITCPAPLGHRPSSDVGERSELTTKIVLFCGALEPGLLWDAGMVHKCTHTHTHTKKVILASRHFRSCRLHAVLKFEFLAATAGQRKQQALLPDTTGYLFWEDWQGGRNPQLPD